MIQWYPVAKIGILVFHDDEERLRAQTEQPYRWLIDAVQCSAVQRETPIV